MASQAQSCGDSRHVPDGNARGSESVDDFPGQSGQPLPGREAASVLTPAIDEAVKRLPGRVVVCIGTDLVDIDQVRAALHRQPRFAQRYFTAGERVYCEILDDPAERFAARLAAKEAVLKALGRGLAGAALTEREVIRLPSGEPT